MSLSKYIIVSLLIALLVQFPEHVFAVTAKESALTKKKDYLTAQQEAAKKQAEQKAQEASAFQRQIDAADQKISETENALTSTEDQIDGTEKKILDLEKAIIVQEEDLGTERGKLNNIAAAWYMEEDSGLLGTVLTSGNLSEMMDRQQYYDSVKQQILASIDKINQLKSDLNKQKEEANNKKTELENLRNQQISYKKSVENQRAVKDQLLDMTLAQRSEYLQRVKQLEGEINQVSAEIYAERARARRGNEQWIYGTSSYPFGNPNGIDPWGFYQMQCTSYAAWYWNIKLGRSWYRGEGPTGTGDAANWPNLASRNNVSVHSSPKVGAIISWQRSSLMPYGHVAIVEAVNSDGTIDLSEYNWVRYSYSYRKNVNPSYYGGYSYIY